MSILRELFGAGTWGTGGNLIAAVVLGIPGYLLRGPLGRSLARHIAPHVARHVAEHLAAAPSGFIQHDGELTEAEFADLKTQWEAAHAPQTQDAPPAAPTTKGT